MYLNCKVWLIEAGSGINYISPRSLPQGIQIISEEIIVNTPASNKMANGWIVIDIDPRLRYQMNYWSNFKYLISLINMNYYLGYKQ